jgi:hypothetical protein
MKENEIVINGVKYIKQNQELTANSIYSNFIGEYCIVRSYGAGVFFGVLNAVEDNYAAILSDARRIHYWDDHTAAACTDLALYGITEKSNSSKSSRVCAAVDNQVLMQVIEIIPCSKTAINCLRNFRVWTEGRE